MAGSLKKICVIDGQGGGIGSTIIKYLKDAFGETIEITAVETNAIASTQMLKAGANRAASGENSVCRMVLGADCVVGPISITWPNSMMGEVTARMAEAVMSCQAFKILIPLSQERVEIVGIVKEPLPHLVQSMVHGKIKEVIEDV